VSAILGTSFGGVVTVALMVVAAAVLFPRHQDVKTLLDAAAGTKTALGRAGLAIFAVGTFAVSAGAGIETSLSGAYSVCQFFGWDWGKRQRPREVPVFFVVIASEVVLAAAIVASGLDPIRITVITMAFAAFTLPFTFAPLLIVANDREYVDHQRNTRMANVVAALVLVLLCIVTLATIPLLILSGGGQ
jgi:Mn2+/Fe2+ NRAMP family transporter